MLLIPNIEVCWLNFKLFLSFKNIFKSHYYYVHYIWFKIENRSADRHIWHLWCYSGCRFSLLILFQFVSGMYKGFDNGEILWTLCQQHCGRFLWRLLCWLVFFYLELILDMYNSFSHLVCRVSFHLSSCLCFLLHAAQW